MPSQLDLFCQAAIDRDGSGETLQDYVLFSAWPAESIANVTMIEPVWMGSHYPFPGLPEPVFNDPWL